MVQLRAPNAVLDAMRALGYPAAQAFQVSKRVHRYDPAEGAEWIRAEARSIRGLDVAGARGRALLQAVAAFEGIPRMRATHFPGVLCYPLDRSGIISRSSPRPWGEPWCKFDKD